MDELLTETNFEDLNTQQSVAFNLGDLKKEEEILNSLLSKMKDQLNKLEVEELELKQKIRRKELKETTAELFPPPPPVPDPPKTKRKGRGKGKGGKPKRKQERTSSVSHDEGGSELDDTLSITSALSQPSPISVRSVKLTPTRRSPRIAKSTVAAVYALRHFSLTSRPTYRRVLEHKFITERKAHKYRYPRNVLLAVAGVAGDLARLFERPGELGDGAPQLRDVDRHEICHVDLPKSVLEKIQLNAAKYPADKVYGSSKKYNEYPENGHGNGSSVQVNSDAQRAGDGVNDGNGKGQPSTDCGELDGCVFKFTTDLDLDQIRDIQSKFVADRNWHQFHTPRNVLFAMVGEIGELSEIFQWKGHVKEGLPEFSVKERINLEHELSDVLIYLIRLSQICHIDLPEAVGDCLEKCDVIFPVDEV